MKTILVLVDFSKAALNAVNYSVEMAMACKAGLLLLYVCDLPVNFTQVPVSLAMDNDRLNAEAELMKLKVKIHRRMHGDLSIFCEVRNGNFFAEVKSFCEHIKPYMVIMGSQGTSIAEKLVFGRHTIYEMRHLPWTLLAIPYKARFSGVEKIALAWDYQNPINEECIEKTRQLVADLGAELHIISVAREEKEVLPISSEALKLKARFSGLTPVFHYLEERAVTKSIIAYVEKNGFDLLMIFPHAYTLLENLIFPTHTKKIVLHCSVPVMALHP